MFSVILCNPPYQGTNATTNKTHSLWKKFIKKSKAYSETLLFVAPDTAISNKGSVKLLKNGGSLSHYKFLGRKHFNVGVNTAHWMWIKDWADDCNVELECGAIIKINKDLIGKLPSSNITPLSVSIQKKILDCSNKLTPKQSKIFHSDLQKYGKHKVLNTTAQGIVNSIKEPVDANDIKVMFSNTGEYKPFLDERNCGTCWHSYSYKVDSKEEAQALLKYFQSSLIVYFNKINREGGFTRKLFADNIPNLKTYKDLDLTDEEIGEIKICSQ
jgi:hypothetical protein